MNEATELIQQLSRDEFYGTITVKFEAGNIVLLRKEETIKPNNYRDNRGKGNGYQQHNSR